MTTDHVTVAILGAGSWGTTFAKVLADAARERDEAITIRLWARREEIADDINTNHTNTEYLEDIVLPNSVTATADPIEAVTGAELVVVAVPAQQARPTLARVADAVDEQAIVVSLIKGLEQTTQATMSRVFTQELNLPAEQFVVVSGPNLAKEIARQEPTATVVACEYEPTAEWVAAMTASSYFRPYRNTDIPGVEIGGVVKNIIALAVGLTDGRGYGDNSKASIITRGLTETTRLATALGAHRDTLAGLAGLGDLVATCASPLSRNRTAGKLYGQGHTTDEVVAQMRQTAEGIKSVAAVVALAHSVKIEMPIAEAVNAVVAGTIEIDNIALLLLGRDLKPEARL